MVQEATILQYFIVSMIGVAVGSHLHEGSHWFVGWIGGTDPVLKHDFWIFASAVDHGKMETMDPSLIRLSGASVFVWIPPAILALFYFFITPGFGTFLAATAMGSVVLMTSESDVVAVRDPEKFRKMWLNDEFARNSVFIPDLLG